MAYQRVLLIPELLEAVLGELPCRDLLLAQRVSTLWRDAVRRSQKLQQALFLLPAGPLVQKKVEDVSTALSSMQLEVQVTSPFISREASSGYWSAVKASGKRYAAIENPLLWKVFHCAQETTAPLTEIRLRAIHDPQASWRKMLLTQPPIAELRIRGMTSKAVTPEQQDMRYFFQCELSPGEHLFTDTTLHGDDDVSGDCSPYRTSFGQHAFHEVRNNKGLGMLDLASFALATKRNLVKYDAILQVEYMRLWKQAEVTAASLPGLLEAPSAEVELKRALEVAAKKAEDAAMKARHTPAGYLRAKQAKERLL